MQRTCIVLLLLLLSLPHASQVLGPANPWAFDRSTRPYFLQMLILILYELYVLLLSVKLMHDAAADTVTDAAAAPAAAAAEHRADEARRCCCGGGGGVARRLRRSSLRRRDSVRTAGYAAWGYLIPGCAGNCRVARV